jgi:hypothetical protein
MNTLPVKLIKFLGIGVAARCAYLGEWGCLGIGLAVYAVGCLGAALTERDDKNL